MVIMVTVVMSAVEQVHQRTRQQQEVRECAQQVRAVLGPEKEASDREEPDDGYTPSCARSARCKGCMLGHECLRGPGAGQSRSFVLPESIGRAKQGCSRGVDL